MAEALIPKLLDFLLINDRDLNQFEGDWDNHMKKWDQHRKLKKLFQPTLKNMTENLPYWLKDFRGNWRLIQPSRQAAIIKEQFNINALKKEVESIRSCQLRFFENSEKNIRELYHKIAEENQKCTPECLHNLESHLKQCKNGCSQKEASHQCEQDDNGGRCRHYYMIKNYEERLDEYHYANDDYGWEYTDALFNYKKAVRIQQLGSLDAYYRELHNDDYYDI